MQRFALPDIALALDPHLARLALKGHTLKQVLLPVLLVEQGIPAPSPKSPSARRVSIHLRDRYSAPLAQMESFPRRQDLLTQRTVKNARLVSNALEELDMSATKTRTHRRTAATVSSVSLALSATK